MMTQPSSMSNTGESQRGHHHLKTPVLPETTQVIFCIFVLPSLTKSVTPCCLCIAFYLCLIKGLELH